MQTNYRDLTYECCYKDLPIQANLERPARKDILGKIHAVIDNHTARQSKSFFMMLTLSYPVNGRYPTDNRAMEVFLKDFKASLERMGGVNLAPSYVWVRENSPESVSPFPRHHYHLILLLDGQKTCRPHKHVDLARRYWAKALNIDSANGLVHYHKSHNGMSGIMMMRNNEQFHSQLMECFRMASYVAKAYSKGTPAGVRDFGGSNVSHR